MGNSPTTYGFQLLEGQVAFCKMISYLPPRYGRRVPRGLPQDEMGAPSLAAKALATMPPTENWTIGAFNRRR